MSKNVLDNGQLTVFRIVRDIGDDQLSVSIDVCNKDNVQHTTSGKDDEVQVCFV